MQGAQPAPIKRPSAALVALLPAVAISVTFYAYQWLIGDYPYWIDLGVYLLQFWLMLVLALWLARLVLRSWRYVDWLTVIGAPALFLVCVVCGLASALSQ